MSSSTRIVPSGGDVVAVRAGMQIGRARRIGFILVVTALVAGVAEASPWAGITTPSAGPPAVIGAAANGCVAGAVALPEAGVGYLSIRRERNRYHGYPRLVEFVEDLGERLARHQDLAMLVGDLAQPRGGLMDSLHVSHQNGLDVDIWFRLVPTMQSVAWRAGDIGALPSMVQPDGSGLSVHWGPPQRFLLQAAATDPRVDRIFVNPVIKRALCESETGDREWLRRVRPWRGHDAHFHVRLACPPSSPECIATPPLPVGDGCGAELAWWFSDEARRPPAPGGARQPDPMPAACQALLYGP